MIPTFIGASWEGYDKNRLGSVWLVAALWGGLLFISILLGAQTAEASGSAKGLFPMMHTYRLSNGLKVILQENHAAPVVAVQMWVRAGSAQEEDRQAGMAHVLEHMLFKGTEKRGLGEIARAVESRGGNLNAFTSHDHTVYHIEMASRYLPVGIEVLADAIQHSTIDGEELKKEGEVILEELKRARDKPGREIFRRLFESAFKVHPYRRPVIGYEETFRSFTRPELLAFYRKWYRPDNMFLVVVGDIDPPKVSELIDRHFGRPWGAEDKLPRHDLPQEPPQEALRAAVFQHPAAKARLAVGFHIPGARDPAVYALDALALILGQGQSSRLYQKVKEEQQLVHSVSSYSLTPRDPGLLLSTAVLDSEKVGPALRSLMKEIYRMAYDGPSEEELEKAKVNLVSEFIYDQETMSGQARSLGYFESLMGDAGAARQYVEKVKALTPADIRQAAGKYLRPSNCTAVVLFPKGEAGGFAEADIKELAVEARAAAAKVAEQQQEVKSRVEKKVLKNGLTLLVKENHAVPTVAIRVALLGGVRYETPETNGVSSLTASLLTRGTADYTAAEFARVVESMAGRVDGFSGRNSLGLTAEFLSGDWERGLKLVAEALLEPAFEPEEIEKEKSDARAAIAQRRDNLFKETLLLFSRSLYDGHPYSMDPLGTEDSVGSMRRQDIVEFYNRVLRPKNMVVAVVGDVNSDAVSRSAERLFGDVATGSPGRIDLPSVERPSSIERAFEERNKRQAHIMLGFPGVKLSSPDRYPLEVIEGVLAGQAGRLFVELRDKRSLSYALTAFARANLDPGFVAVYVGTSPDKVEDAVSGVRRELGRLIDSPVSAEELEEAKRAIIGLYELRHQTNAAQAESLALMELYGLGYQAVREYPARIQTVTSEDLQRVARRYLTLDRYVLAVVGPRSNNATSPPARRADESEESGSVPGQGQVDTGLKKSTEKKASP